MCSASRVGGKADGSTSLDVHGLDKLVKHFIDGSLAESTLRMYTSGQRRYRSFCGKVGVNPPPLNEVQVCRFEAYLVLNTRQSSVI